jgi:hypothetical protein
MKTSALWSLRLNFPYVAEWFPCTKGQTPSQPAAGTKQGRADKWVGLTCAIPFNSSTLRHAELKQESWSHMYMLRTEWSSRLNPPQRRISFHERTNTVTKNQHQFAPKIGTSLKDFLPQKDKHRHKNTNMCKTRPNWQASGGLTRIVIARDAICIGNISQYPHVQRTGTF